VVARARGNAGDKLRVGINWSGNPGYAHDRIRSTGLETFKTLLEIPQVHWFSLHKGHREAEADSFNLSQPLKGAADFYDTATVISALDLVVSTESLIPNLSAALGIPTCLVTSPDPDWRWNSWYRNVTVCPQRSLGRWDEPLARVQEIVQARLAATAQDR